MPAPRTMIVVAETPVLPVPAMLEHVHSTHRLVLEISS